MQATFINDEYSQDPISAIKFARDSGLSCLELRSMWGKRNICDLSSTELSHLKQLLSDSGIAACVIDTFAFKRPFGTVEDRQADLDLADKAADIAAFLGAGSIRVFAFWADTAPAFPVIASEIRSAADRVRDRGVHVLVENGTFSSVGQGSNLAELLKEINDPIVSGLWDPGNVINGGWPESVEDGLAALVGQISHVHIKNPHVGTPGEYRFGPMTGGTIDWARQISTLHESGYDGLLSLETHWRQDRVLCGRDTFDFPNGYGFSDGGEKSTAEMLGELTDLLKRH
jgi:L-ribulose-5-phosphate 3-epimerase